MTTPATTTAAVDPSLCPRCSSATVSVKRAEPWCPRCEWDLDRYEPDRRRPEFGWRWIDRRTHALAYRLTRRQFTELTERTLRRRGLTAARIVTTVASVLLLLGVLLLAAVGAWLTTYGFPSLNLVVGVALIGMAVVLRPRFGRVDPMLGVLSRDRAPELFTLIDEVATAVGAPRPHVVVVDDTFNAYATAVGLRRRRLLCLGLPLWGSLRPQERVALLGHELGHFVNGDVRRGLLTQPAFTMLASAADLVAPSRGLDQSVGIASMLGDAVGKLFQWVLARLLFGAHLLLISVALRDTQRAEYRADELAARAGGSAAAVGLTDAFLAGDTIEMLVRREARAGHGAARWRAAADEARAAVATEVQLLRQLSVRDQSSLFASHPPDGLRCRMVEAREWRSPAVGLTDSRSDRIDAELARDYERTRRVLAWSH